MILLKNARFISGTRIYKSGDAIPDNAVTRGLVEKGLAIIANDRPPAKRYKPEGITKAGGTLYWRVHDIKGNFTAGSQLKLDGKLYTILDASIIQDQVWRVTLEANK